MQSTFVSPAVRPCPVVATAVCCRPRVRCCATAQDTPVASTSKEQVIKFGSGAEFVINEDPELKSTWAQRGTVAGASTLLALLAAHGWVAGDNVVTAAASVFAGIVFADIGSGIYHWSVDNYGSGDTPVVGTQIAAFQGHHCRPWTITQREFCNNVSLTFRPGGVAAAIILSLALLGVTSPEVDIWASTSIFFICLSQQFHAWSHMKKSQLPAAVVALQDANIIISRQQHGAHHRAPFSCNYCIVNGWCNPILDAGLMHKAEELIQSTFGVEPRCWSDPSADWREQVPPETM